MLRYQWFAFFFLFWLLPKTPALGQAAGDPGVLRFAHIMESRRVDALESSRREAAGYFVAVAEEIISLSEGSGPRMSQLLWEAQYLADSIAVLDRQLDAAAPAAREARHALINALEAQLTTVRRAAAEADPQRRPVLESQIRDLEAELREIRKPEDPARTIDPLSSAYVTLSALARVVTEERARLRTLRVVQDEIRLFMGNLRLFDETGMPPSVRSEGGGDPDPGCPISACPTDLALTPADVPFEHFRSDGGGDGERARETSVTAGTLARLQEQISAFADLRGPSTEDSRRDNGTVTRETMLGAGLMSFRGEGEGRAGWGLKAGTSFLFSRLLGGSIQLTVEPWLGARGVQLDPGSSAEAAGEVRETLAGASLAGRRARWQVTSWQKGRLLSDPLPLPAYLEPGRIEGGLAGRVAIPFHPRWDLEAGGGGDAVHYGPEEWNILNRRGLNASMAAIRQGESNSARFSLLGSRHTFAADGDQRREDTRLGVGADWSLERRAVVRLSVGMAWNDSRLQAYDYRSGRVALVLSAPWGRNSVLGYGALAQKSYLNPGPVDGRVAPSDQDTGSILALQFTRPLDATHALIVRAEWSRSETGFRNDFYQRFGISVQVAFRGMGGI